MADSLNTHILGYLTVHHPKIAKRFVKATSLPKQTEEAARSLAETLETALTKFLRGNTTSSSESDSDSSSSSSEDSSSSESSSDEAESTEPAPVKKATAAATSSSSSSEEEEVKPEKSKKRKEVVTEVIAVTAQKEQQSEEEERPAKKMKIDVDLEKNEAKVDAPASKNGKAGPRTQNVPFRRVKTEEVVVDDRLRDNSFAAKGGSMNDYGAKAARDLIVTRGDSFRKEKTKKKRGSYRGGEITLQSHSIKFDD